MPDNAPPPSPATRPSSSLLQNLRQELMRHAPFAHMTAEHVDRFIAGSSEAYFAPDETIFAPTAQAVSHLCYLRRGIVLVRRASGAGADFQHEPGELFPLGAAVGARAVASTYVAGSDVFCLQLPVDQMQALAADSPPFAEFLQRRIDRLLQLSRQALQASQASRTLSEQSMETRLGELMHRRPLAVAPATPLRAALQQMLERKVGSTLVLDEGGQALGIFTRDDLIGRVVLPQVPLDTPIAHLMSTPVHSLDADHSALDAALLMAQHGVRHVPVTEHGRVAGVVSERDLFALQRLSLTHVSQAIRRAEDLGALQHAAADIRRFAERLLGQGIAARQLTELISQLNDLLTARLVALVAKARGCDLGKACWLAFGSEGRGEQTLATDQDNGLIFTGAETERSVWLDFAREVNEGLDTCGYPLCRGNVMASNPQCCLTAAEWRERFEAWMQRGAPQDLLQASIFFDLRALAGRLELAAPLQAFITDAAAKPPRFIKQLALNAMQRRPPLNWRGALETREVEGRACIDVKLQGTAIFVDAARIYALALGVPAVGTRQRLEGIAQALQLDATETGAWIGGFEFLQSLRLGLQIGARGAAPATAEAANLLAVDTLNDIDRRMLREALRMAQRLQQRLEMDYDR